MTTDDMRRTARGGRTGRQVNRTNLSAEVAGHIKELIFEGSLEGGQRIPQDAIAEDLGVSRLPVREALIGLQADGLVENEPHRGAFVVPLTREDIRDHYAMYGWIQGLAAARAATKIDESVVERLEALIVEMRRHPDAPSTNEAHWEFHSLINHVGGSRRLRSVLRQMAHNLPRSVYDVPPAASPEAEAGHLEIVQALRAGDSTRVATACEAHLKSEGELVVAELERRGLFRLSR
ncbi:GntR family transcriptional regulator [Nonomuraea lactucae]|uniref:GntR family transcriptional regulator n=1 Tax=Nonomuraea lactucae TaxID=2249762 RepID=UPI0019637851|nr:GntR family transcriptional regulator [Nonomuraea lactucae]